MMATWLFYQHKTEGYRTSRVSQKRKRLQHAWGWFQELGSYAEVTPNSQLQVGGLYSEVLYYTICIHVSLHGKVIVMMIKVPLQVANCGESY